MTTSGTYTVRFKGFPDEFAAFVRLDDEPEVRVRRTRTRPRWRCDDCGKQPAPTCRHAVAADLAATSIARRATT